MGLYAAAVKIHILEVNLLTQFFQHLFEVPILLLLCEATVNYTLGAITLR